MTILKHREDELMDDMHVPEGKLKGKYKRIGAKVGRVVIIMQAFSIAVVMLVCVFMYSGHKDADRSLYQRYKYAGL